MIVLVIVLALVAAAAIVVALVARARLAAQRAATAVAMAEAAERTGERDAERERAAAAEAARDEATARADTAEARAAEADTRAAGAETQATEAAARFADAEARAAEAASRNGLDPDVVWLLERARSDRTWRQSVAIGATSSSVFDGTDHPLREALQVELDAAREDVGAIVDLHLDAPPDVTAAGSVLVLRAAQELLAQAVKAAEQTTLHVVADGADVVVTVEATDEHGMPVTVAGLALPASADVEATDGGVRVKRALPGR